jgi:hypothetical protein
LVEELSPKLEKLVGESIQPNERVYIKLKGANPEALICTDRRVMILKIGGRTGHMFGSGVFQAPYRNITGAQVCKGMLMGYFEISAGGVQNRITTFHGAVRAENCVSLTKDLIAKFQAAGTFILSKVL